MKTSLTDAIILCGGAGLRLRPVIGHQPKSMAHVSGRPFLETLLRQLHRYEFQRVILASGYGAAAIQSYFGKTFCGMDLEYSNESSPLGTGGAVRNAAAHASLDTSLVMNGDSYTDADLRKFVTTHCESEADVSVVVVPVDQRGDVGSVVLDDDGSVVQFVEKERSPSARYLNAGIYMLSREIVYDIPSGLPLSLERELFPAWIANGRRIRAFIHAGKCVDIGTPERYQSAQGTLAGAELGTGRAGNGEN
jgi:mannose-1-phosphate guanylyltransferase